MNPSKLHSYHCHLLTLVNLQWCFGIRVHHGQYSISLRALRLYRNTFGQKCPRPQWLTWTRPHILTLRGDSSRCFTTGRLVKGISCVCVCVWCYQPHEGLLINPSDTTETPQGQRSENKNHLWCERADRLGKLKEEATKSPKYPNSICTSWPNTAGLVVWLISCTRKNF